MIGVLFSFRGRMGRLSYLGWTFAVVGLTVVIGYAALLGGLAAMPSLGRQNTPILFLIVYGLLAILIVWSSLALSVKRIRDTGFPPWLVIGVAWTVIIIDRLGLLNVIGASLPSPFEHQTAVGGVMELAYLLFLLFWPSEAVYHWTGGAGDDRPIAEPIAAPVAPAAPLAPAAPAIAPAPVRRLAVSTPMASSAPRREFGLRQR